MGTPHSQIAVQRRRIIEARRRGTAWFTVHDEGSGVRSLYLAPTNAQELGAALYPLAFGHQLAMLSPLPAPAGCQPLPSGGWLGPGRAILGLREPVQAAVVGPQVRAEDLDHLFPCSVLAQPEHAFSDALGTRFCLDVEGSQHAILLSRDPEVHCACLETVLERCAEQGLSRLAPRVTSQALCELLEPMPLGQWRRVTTSDEGRYHVLQIETASAGQVLDRRRWVAAPQGSQWNADWSW